ncbi:hypothetical protein C8Q80DRAFT_1104953 [Daedaleopsis nitida]|nr:hypothetical protein C8Q80DRAFT_1104953 [Daedaleopsis nitida]
MVEVMRAHDLLALSSPSTPDPDDWLAHDDDVECSIYLFVHPAHDRTPTRWSVAWPVGILSLASPGMTAWRHVQLESLGDDLGAEDETHYGYFGAITKSAGPDDGAARRYELGRTNLAHRRDIERLARTVPVLVEIEGWSCQDWVKELLEKMVAADVVSASACNHAMSQAQNGGTCYSSLIDFRLTADVGCL